MGIEDYDPERGGRISLAMKARGMNAAALAVETEVNKSTVGHWLNGKPLTVPSLVKLASALRTTRAWILEGDAAEPPPGTVEMLLEEIAQSRTDFLTGLTALTRDSDEQRKALEDLLTRVERLERTRAGSRS